MSYKYLKASRAAAGESKEVLEINVPKAALAAGVIVQHDKTRRYSFFPTMASFWEWYDAQSDPMYHEVVLGHVPQRLKFDIDAPSGHATTLETIIEGILDVFFRLYFVETGYSLCREELAVFSSCGPDKDSYHILVRPYVVANCAESRHFTAVLCEYLGEDARFIDQGVNKSNQGFRLVRSRKHNSTRVKTPVDSAPERESLVTNHYGLPVLPECAVAEEKHVHFSSEDTAAVLNVVKQAGLLASFEYKDRIDGLFVFTRTAPSLCRICRRTHDNDNTLMVTVDKSEHRTVLQLCRHAPGHAHPLGRLADIDGLQRLIRDPPRAMPSLFDLRAEYQHVYCEPHMREYERVRTLAVQGPMGAGKTKNIIKYLENEEHGIPKTVLLITFRQTFSEAMRANLDAGFEMYSDTQGPLLFSKHPRLIVQVESLHRVRTNDEPLDLLILDEMESVLAQFHSGLHKNFSASFMAFQILLNTAERVICMDANLGDAAYTVLSEMRPEHPIHFHKNTYQSATHHEYHITTQYDAWVSALNQYLRDGKRIVIATNSKQEATVLGKMVGENYPAKKVGLYSSATDGVIRAEHFSHVERYWALLDVLIYTPTVSAGISFEQKHFDAVFAHFSDMSCPAEDCRQMLGRIRQVGENKYFVHIRATRSWHPTDTRELDQLMQGRKASLFQTSLNPELRAMVDFAVRETYSPSQGVHRYKSPYYTLWLQHARRTNLSRNNFAKVFIEQVRATGATVTEKGYDHFTPFVFDKKRIKKEAQLAEDTMVANARDLTQAEFEELATITAPSQEDRVAVQKHYLRAHYNYHEPLTPSFVHEYSRASIKTIFRNLSQVGKYASLQQAVHAVQLEELALSVYTFQNVPNEQLSVREGLDLHRRYTYNAHRLALHILKQCGFYCIRDPSIGYIDMLHDRLHAARDDVFANISQLAFEFNMRRPLARLKDPERYIKALLSFYNTILRKMYGIEIVGEGNVCYIKCKISDKFNGNQMPRLELNLAPADRPTRFFIETKVYVCPDPM